jgi:hypothetical protein
MEDVQQLPIKQREALRLHYCFLTLSIKDEKKGRSGSNFNMQKKQFLIITSGDGRR